MGDAGYYGEMMSEDDSGIENELFRKIFFKHDMIARMRELTSKRSAPVCDPAEGRRIRQRLDELVEPYLELSDMMHEYLSSHVLYEDLEDLEKEFDELESEFYDLAELCSASEIDICDVEARINLGCGKILARWFGDESRSSDFLRDLFGGTMKAEEVRKGSMCVN